MTRLKFKQTKQFASRLIAGTLLVLSSASALAQEAVTPGSVEVSSEWLHWKMFNVHPRLATGLTYDDNITLQHTNALSDVIYNLTPGVSVVGGDPLAGDKLLTLDYLANIQFFLEHKEFDAVDHVAKISGLLPFAKLTLGGSAIYEKVRTPDVVLGLRVQRTGYGIGLTARYDLSPKTSLEENFTYRKTEYAEKGLIGSREFFNDNWINHQISSKVNLGLGITLGKLDQDFGPAQTYERLLLRAVYTLTYKLDLTASAGGEWRQYRSFDQVVGRLVIISGPPTNSMTNTVPIVAHEKASSSFAPVFNIGAIFRPREGTTINLEAHRSDQNSPTLAGYNYTLTGFSVGVRQKFLQRFSANFGGSYGNASYHAASKNRGLTREDSYYAVNAGVDALITKRWVAGISALHRSGNSSDSSGTIFDNNQVTVQTTYSF